MGLFNPKPYLLAVLLKLAEQGAASSWIRVTTSELAEMLEVSQQSASRYLLQLERLGLAERKKEGRGELVRISPLGVKRLNSIYTNLKRAFEGGRQEAVLVGRLFRGLGEGAYYVSLPGYRRQFRDKLGFDPYPGTLNLRLEGDYLKEKKEVESWPCIWIKGFRDKLRTYGPVKCYPAKINDIVDGALILPVRTHYAEDVFEVIAPISIRRKFKLKDGDSVRVKVFSPSRRQAFP